MLAASPLHRYLTRPPYVSTASFLLGFTTRSRYTCFVSPFDPSYLRYFTTQPTQTNIVPPYGRFKPALFYRTVLHTYVISPHGQMHTCIVSSQGPILALCCFATRLIHMSPASPSHWFIIRRLYVKNASLMHHFLNRAASCDHRFTSSHRQQHRFTSSSFNFVPSTWDIG